MEIPHKHFFGPSQFYCVETICAPCGIVIAWTKFNRSESPTNILNLSIPQNNHDQVIFALIKPVECYEQLFQIKAGKCGKEQLVLLWIHIIISTITN